MKTQLYITVENGGLYTRATSSLFWFSTIFKKSQINLYIDSRDAKPITLTARSKPYEIEITPGYHEILIDDVKGPYRRKAFGFMAKLTAGAMTAGMFAGAGMSILPSAVLASEMVGGKSAIKDNVLVCNLSEGDELRVSVKPKLFTVKIRMK